MCPNCGQHHDTIACPPQPLPTPDEAYEASGMGRINGLTFGEHEICRRLDKLIELLSPAREEQASE